MRRIFGRGELNWFGKLICYIWLLIVALPTILINALLGAAEQVGLTCRDLAQAWRDIGTNTNRIRW